MDLKRFRTLLMWAALVFMVVPCSSAAGSGELIPWLKPKIGETVIACFHKEARRFTAERHPRDCAFAGTRGRDRWPVVFPMRGMRWGHWGAGRTRAAEGVGVLNGSRLSVIAYRRVECSDRSVWYSESIILNVSSGHYFGIHLPVCLNLRSRSKATRLNQ